MEIKILQTTVTDQKGNVSSLDSLRVDIKSYEKGSAVWVDGTLETGFAGEESIVLRLPLEESDGYVAIESHSPFWTRPFFGKDLQALPSLTQMLLLHLANDSYKCYLPVCADTFKTVLRGCEGGMEAVVFSNCDGVSACQNQLAFVVTEGQDPYAVLHDAASLAAELLGNGLLLREDRKMPEALNYLGWCTWDAFHFRVSHKGLLEKAKEFKEKNVPVRFAILDDMWADVPSLKELPCDIPFRDMVNVMHQSRIRSFEGDSERFPKGMQAAITDLKAAGIPTVGLWYPITGYWKGFEADGAFVREYPECFARASHGKWHKDEDEIMLVKPEEAAAGKFFDVLAARAKSWGVDFIKVDNQGHLMHYKNIKPVGESARVMQSAIDASAFAHFDGALINCMGMPSECMFHRPKSAVSRCSDDFMPESREWFSKNILQCSYNGLLQGQFYINDWDMFWTDDEQARKNSLCRAISGGPIYVSDKLGRTRPEILQPLALANGRILRPDNSAKPTKDCLTVDPLTSKKPFKIFNRVGDAGLVAAFHIDAEASFVEGFVSPDDAELSKKKHVSYEYFSGKCRVLAPEERVSLKLESRDDFRLFTFVPYAEITHFGRLDKMIGIKAIEQIDGDTVTLLEGGKIGFYCEKPVRVFSDTRELAVNSQNGISFVLANEDETKLRFVISK